MRQERQSGCKFKEALMGECMGGNSMTRGVNAILHFVPLAFLLSHPSPDLVEIGRQ